MKHILLFVIASAACVCALFAGCAQPPQQEITNAKNAIESAKEAKAPIFAEEQFKAAQALLDSALADMRAQNTKSPFSQDYKKTKQMLTSALAAAEASITAVPANKAKIYEEAKTLFDKVKPMIIESDKLLEYPLSRNNKEAALLKVKLNAVMASLPQDISRVPDESLLMTLNALRMATTSLGPIKASVEKLNPSKKEAIPIPKPAPKKGKKKRR